MEVQEFYAKLRIKDIHQCFNYVEVEDLDRIFRQGSRSIDLITAISNLIQYVEGSKLLEINEVVNTDHHSYLINTNLEMYFDKEFSGWDKINKRMLDLNKRTHQKKFKEFTNELLDTIPIEDTIFEITRGDMIRETMEKVDQDTSFLLNKVKNRIEEQ